MVHHAVHVKCIFVTHKQLLITAFSKCYLHNTHLNGMNEILVKAPNIENVNKLIVLQHHLTPSINS